MIESSRLKGDGIARTAAGKKGPAASGRPRNQKIDEQILTAARELLAQGGYDALTFEAIVSRTGIGRPTIYRRWPSKAHLAAQIAYGPEEDLQETTTSLSDQLLVLARQMSRSYHRPEISSAIAGLNSAYQNDPALREELHTRAEAGARRQLQAIVARLKARGAIDQQADADLLFDMIVGAVTFRLIFSSMEHPADFEEALAARLYRAFRPA